VTRAAVPGHSVSLLVSLSVQACGFDQHGALLLPSELASEGRPSRGPKRAPRGHHAHESVGRSHAVRHGITRRHSQGHSVHKHKHVHTPPAQMLDPSAFKPCSHVVTQLHGHVLPCALFSMILIFMRLCVMVWSNCSYQIYRILEQRNRWHVHDKRDCVKNLSVRRVACVKNLSVRWVMPSCHISSLLWISPLHKITCTICIRYGRGCNLLHAKQVWDCSSLDREIPKASKLTYSQVINRSSVLVALFRCLLAHTGLEPAPLTKLHIMSCNPAMLMMRMHVHVISMYPC
jgi:hypothetical protein